MPPSTCSSEVAVACRWDGADLVLRVRVQPRASASGFAGLHGDRVKIRLAAPPVEGAANAELIALLAETFGVARRDVSLVAGDSGRAKTVRVRAPRRLPPGLPVPARPD